MKALKVMGYRRLPEPHSEESNAASPLTTDELKPRLHQRRLVKDSSPTKLALPPARSVPESVEIRREARRQKKRKSKMLERSVTHNDTNEAWDNNEDWDMYTSGDADAARDANEDWDILLAEHANETFTTSRVYGYKTGEPYDTNEINVFRKTIPDMPWTADKNVASMPARFAQDIEQNEVSGLLSKLVVPVGVEAPTLTIVNKEPGIQHEETPLDLLVTKRQRRQKYRRIKALHEIQTTAKRIVEFSKIRHEAASVLKQTREIPIRRIPTHVAFEDVRYLGLDDTLRNSSISVRLPSENLCEDKFEDKFKDKFDERLEVERPRLSSVQKSGVMLKQTREVPINRQPSREAHKEVRDIGRDAPPDFIIPVHLQYEKSRSSFEQKFGVGGKPRLTFQEKFGVNGKPQLTFEQKFGVKYNEISPNPWRRVLPFKEKKKFVYVWPLGTTEPIKVPRPLLGNGRRRNNSKHIFHKYNF